MSKTLCIETTNIVSVSLHADKILLKSLESRELYAHSVKIIVLIQQLLQETQTAWSEIDTILINKGPGSFTGMRIGLAAALGFQLSTHASIKSCRSFEILAGKEELYEHSALILIDSKRSDYYAALKDPYQPSIKNIFISDIKTLEREYNHFPIIITDSDEILKIFPHAQKKILQSTDIFKTYSLYPLLFSQDLSPYYLKPPAVYPH